MEYIKQKVELQKALFFDLLQIADKFQGEDIINNSVLLFFENGQEIISNGEQKKAYHQYLYRPLNEYAEGDIAAGTNVNNQNVAIALHAYWDGVTSIPTYADVYLLQIKSVSEIEYDSERKVLEIG
jgi:hypothetical protein